MCLTITQVDEVGAFRERWKPFLQDGDAISVKPYNNWAEHEGTLEQRGLSFRTPCLSFLWDFLAVTWNGRVLPCCFDCEADLVVGDAKVDSLREIWNGADMRELRQAHLELDFERFAICEGCDHTTERLDGARLKRMIRSRASKRALVTEPV